MRNKKKKLKNNMKEKLISILNSYKTIIYISFAINIILLFVCYSNMSSNKIYTFSGEDEYLKVRDGIVVLNNDINLINGNNIKYINSKDYEVVSYKIGYYVMDNNKLVEIVSTNLELETEIKISEIVNNFTSFNLAEKDKDSVYFTDYKKDLIDSGLYLILEAKTKDGVNVFSKVKLNITKVSRF